MSNVGRGFDITGATAHRNRALHAPGFGHDQYEAVKRGRHGLSEVGTGVGLYEVTVRDRRGRLLQRMPFHNVRTLEGYAHMLEVGFGGAPQVNQWRLGLRGSGTSAETDTHTSHAAWTEITAYDEAERPLWTPGAVSAAVGGGRQIDNFGNDVTFTASSNITVHGAFMASLSAKGSTAASDFVPSFSDDFTGTNGSAPNASKWTVQESAGSSATIQGNELRLRTGGTGSIGNWEDYARMIADHAEVDDCQVDFAITIPDTLPEWFWLISLRGNGNWASDPTFPVFPQVGYWLQIASPHGAADDPVAFIGKADPTGTTKVDLSAQDGLEFADGVSELFARFQVTNEATGVRVRAAVRDQALGPIPADTWDIDVLDDTGTTFPAAGLLQLGLGGSDQADQIRDVFIDNLTFAPLVTGIIPSVGAFSSPISLSAGNTLTARARLIHRNA